MKKYFAILVAVSMIFAGTAMADVSNIADRGGEIDNAAAAGASSQADSEQVQGQEQLTAIDQLNGGLINNSFNSQGMRGFAIPADPNFAPLINSYHKPLPSEGFQPVEELIMYSCWFTEGALESMLKGVEKAEAEFKVANTNIANAAVAPEDGETRWIKIVISKDKYTGKNVGFKGFITARSENRRTTMTETMAKAAHVAVKNGCNVIHFTAQGAVRDTQSFGWGIGFNTTQAQIYDGQDKSNVSAGGFGISGGTAGTRDKPWLQGFGLVDADLVYPALSIPVEVDKKEAKITEKPAPTKTAGAQAIDVELPQTGNHTSYGTSQDS